MPSARKRRPSRSHSEPAPPGVDISSFDRVYRDWFTQVTRWARTLGVPTSELEDLAQEVFIVVHRKLPQFVEGNFPGWLYRITELTVRDRRQRAWFKHLLHGQRGMDVDQLLESADNPGHAYELKEDCGVVSDILGRMSEKRRSALLLFELEGLSGAEIAALYQIPLRTLWTRLYHARRDFAKMLARRERTSREEHRS